MTGLVAPPEAGQSGLELYKCIAIVGPAVTVAVDFANGEPLGGFISLVGTAADVAAAVVDPIAALASSVASIMLTYLPPLPQYLDILVGNPGAVAGFAETWTNIQNRLETCKDDVLSLAEGVLGEWTGAAASAYRESVTAFGQVMGDVAEIAAGVGSGLKLTSEIIGVIRQIVVQLVSDLVGKLISAVVEEGASFGLGTPLVIAQLVTTIAKYAKDASEWTKGLSSAITKVASRVDEINNVLHVVVPGLKTAEHELTVITLTHILDDAYEFMTEATNSSENEPQGSAA